MKQLWFISKVCDAPPPFDEICSLNGDLNNLYFVTDERYLFKVNKKTHKILDLGSQGGVLISGMLCLDNLLYFMDSRSRILSYSTETRTTAPLVAVKQMPDGQLQEFKSWRLQSMVKDNHGNLLVKDDFDIWKIDLARKAHKIGELRGPSKWDTAAYYSHESIAVDREGIIYSTDATYDCIRKLKDGEMHFVVDLPSKQTIKDKKKAMKKTHVLRCKSDGTLFCSDSGKLCIINPTLNKISTFFHPDLHIQQLYLDSDDIIYLSSMGSIFKMETCWKWERMLWIGHYKEEASYCWLASVPKDVITEIAASLHVVLSHYDDALKPA